jgi:hypothetical protein
MQVDPLRRGRSAEPCYDRHFTKCRQIGVAPLAGENLVVGRAVGISDQLRSWHGSSRLAAGRRTTRTVNRSRTQSSRRDGIERAYSCRWQ